MRCELSMQYPTVSGDVAGKAAMAPAAHAPSPRVSGCDEIFCGRSQLACPGCHQRVTRVFDALWQGEAALTASLVYGHDRAREWCAANPGPRFLTRKVTGVLGLQRTARRRALP